MNRQPNVTYGQRAANHRLPRRTVAGLRVRPAERSLACAVAQARIRTAAQGVHRRSDPSCGCSLIRLRRCAAAQLPVRSTHST
jgi:hypothetical protein